MSGLLQMLSEAKAELACPGCANNPKGQFRSSGGLAAWDECRICHGEHRNTATIKLLDALVDHATDYVRKTLA